MSAPQVRSVHPVCTKECTHDRPLPPPDLAAFWTPVYAGPPAYLPAEPPRLAGPRCASCGYQRDDHELGTFKCPQATADKAGRRGKWKDAPPPDTRTWREIMRDASAARAAAIEEARRPYEPEVVPPPLVPARPPAGPAEIAGYQGKQAVGLGRKAAAAGWTVSAAYWQAHDGSEGCAVQMRRADLFAVATWTRKPGGAGKLSGWSADVAYGLKRGTAAIKMTHTELERIFDAPA